MNETGLKKVKEDLGKMVLAVEIYRGDVTIVVPRDKILDVCQYLKNSEDHLYDLFIDIAAIDYSKYVKAQPERFALIYQLYSLRYKERTRIKVFIPQQDPRIQSINVLWAAANWFEREAFDMMGIRFEGHPDLRRILCHDDFVGHALRKDYPIQKRQKLKKVADMYKPFVLKE